VIDSGGVANGGVDTDQTANTITFDVLSVNDAPAGVDKTINLYEDTAYQFSSADFGFTDTDGNSFNTVEIVAILANGTLQTTTGAVVAGDVISAAAINGMTYTPPLNASGSAYDSLAFKVRDDGGTLNGGVDTDAVDTGICRSDNQCGCSVEPAVSGRFEQWQFQCKL